MSRNRGILVSLLLICSSLSICRASVVRPISDAHRSAALELFVPIDGSLGSLEDTYEALRTFQILGLEINSDLSRATCQTLLLKLGSSSSTSKDLLYALRINGILGCQIETTNFEDIVSKLQDNLKGGNSLLDLYCSVGGLLLIKKQGFNVILSDAGGVFHNIKALSQSDGRWRFDSSGAESSTYAAGIALETLAGVVSLADSEIEQSVVNNGIVSFFRAHLGLLNADDETLYFDEKRVHANNFKSPLEISASVIRGVTAFAEVASGRLNIPGNKMLGLAKFFLSIGIPGSSKDLFNQLDALSCLENNSRLNCFYPRIYIPLIVSLPAVVLSLTSRDQLKVDVTTVFGSSAPSLTVTLAHAINSKSEEDELNVNQELHFDQENSIHYLDIVPLKMDVGKYRLVFKASLHDPEDGNKYTTGEQTSFSIFLTGSIKVDKGEIAIINSDGGSIETVETLDLSKDSSLSLSANHLQKFRLSFQLASPLGQTFKPHQVFLKLRHESKVEHIFLIDISSRQFKLTLDFLGLVEKFYYLSGKYDIKLAVGDATMENSFLSSLGCIELDLPEAPEKATQPPLQPVDPFSRYGPRQEISHIFRAPEKRPPKELSLAFLVLTILPFLGFIFGLIRLGVNLKSFPSAPLQAAFSILFHAGIAAVLLLYVLFWWKLNLFTTLKGLGLLSIFLVLVGHRTLSYLASTSAKLKSA
ncbi:Dolichyl-diphosphooligosaccharide--protein glycosyltransferase subunit 2 [Apostasia shenzhenica]|uniref:Dolichyl-diphosphooligosaccharide--protein glycosyltransferase subunit 2 n=1 Tax=Apostasia shenzhenica TaxID=1088818 RepID=A0A2I0B4I3_9ASPA|nr:Dolichyl-diphosphooligosaccharide--protein glycosyltransferase subunit 2 [Apostasia shenzhenica]